jgi:hypothetical protein
MMIIILVCSDYSDWQLESKQKDPVPSSLSQSLWGTFLFH